MELRREATMAARRGTRLWITGVLGLAALVGMAAFMLTVGGRGSKGRGGAGRATVAFDAKTPLPALCQPLRASDARALAALFQKTTPEPNKPIANLTETEAAQWVE